MRTSVLSVLASATLSLAGCASGSAARPVPTTTARATSASAPCRAVSPEELGRVFGTRFGPPTASGGSGWITAQCTWSGDARISVSLAVGSTRSLAATGYAGSVAQFIAERERSDSTRSTVHPLEGIADGGYYTATGAPMLVAYQGDSMVQVLTFGIDRPITADELLAVGRAVVSGLGR